MSDGDRWWESFFLGPWGDLQAGGYPAERTKQEVDFIIETMGLSPGNRVLDIPCGEGRHSIALAARQYVVTGVDFNAKAIATARQRAIEQGVHVEFFEADMRSFEAPAVFDAALCLFGSFGYFSDDDNLRFAAQVAKALTRGGRFLIETHVMETLFDKFRERDWAWANDQPGSDRVLEERRWDFESRRVVTTWTFVRSGSVESLVSSIRLYGYRELCDLLREAGFREFKAFETGSLAPFKLGSRRLSLVAST